MLWRKSVIGFSDPNSEESPAADDGIEPENELPVQVTGYEIRYDRVNAILTCRTANSR